MTKAAFIVLSLNAVVFAVTEIGINAGCGYTHYNPADLNEVNRIFEKTSRQMGFKGYKVEEFDGHIEQTVSGIVNWKHWQVGLESEIWKESFSQHNVPFTFGDLTGAVTANENYLFVPTVCMLSYNFRLGRFVLSPGYGAGVMLGNASVDISTVYTGGARPDDALKISISSGANIVHRLSFESMVKPFQWLGFGFCGGYRYSVIKYFQVTGVNGYSYIFNLLFNGGAKKDDKLYISQEYEALLFTDEQNKQPYHHLVEGNISGVFAWFKVFFFYGGFNHGR